MFYFFFAFVFNLKSFGISILVFSFFFFLLQLFGRTAKSFLGMFYESLPSKRVTKIRLISLDTLKKVTVKIVSKVLFETHVANDFFFLFLFNHDSLHARLNRHCEAWSYKKKEHKKITAYSKPV